MTLATALTDKRVVRSAYARNVLTGAHALSGADLLGRAREYGGRYAALRKRAVEVARAHGGHIRRGPRGKLTLEWHPVPEGAEPVACALGAAWAY